MAKNISLWGASYPDVPAVDLPKTGGGTARFVDADGVVYSTYVISYTIDPSSAGTAYPMVTVSNYIPAGKTYIGVLKVSAIGAYDIDGGVVECNNGSVVYYVPKTSQPGLLVKFVILYK